MDKKINNFTIEQIARKGGPHNMPSKHYHERLEIYYLLQGERYYFINNQTYHIKRGDLVLINKNILHKTIDAKNPAHERILIEFNDSFLKSFIEDIKDINLFKCFKLNQYIISFTIEEQIWVEDLLFKMVQEYKQQRDGYISYLKSLLIELLIFLNRQMKEKNHTSKHPDQTHKKFSEIAGYINKNFHKKLTLEQVAEKFNYSPTYLSKTFKKVTGFNFVEYKNNIRVKEARKLLQQTDLNVSKIANMVGYNNLTHFGRTFKKITGYSPLQYRKFNSNKLSTL